MENINIGDYRYKAHEFNSGIRLMVSSNHYTLLPGMKRKLKSEGLFNPTAAFSINTNIVLRIL